MWSQRSLKVSHTQTRGGGGEFDLLSRISTHGFLLPPNTFYGSKFNTQEDNRGGGGGSHEF